MHGAFGMAKKPPPPPPPPPPKGKKAPPPPPPPPKKKAPPPPKPNKAPSEKDLRKQIDAAVEAEDFELAAKLKKSLPDTKKKTPPPPKKKTPPPPKKAPPSKPKAPPTKKKQIPGGSKKQDSPKKGRRIKIKLGLKQTRLSGENDTTEPEDIGWTISQETLEAYDEPESTGPEIISHQCSMCGSVMQIPSPKRDRYKVICAYSECGHEDTFGI